MKDKNIFLLTLILLFGCNRPIDNLSKFEGCFFAAGQNPVIHIKNLEIYDYKGKHISKILKIKNEKESSIIELSDGVKFIDNSQKSMIIDRGDSYFLMAYSRGSETYILAPWYTAIELKRQSC